MRHVHHDAVEEARVCSGTNGVGLGSMVEMHGNGNRGGPSAVGGDCGEGERRVVLGLGEEQDEAR